MNRSERLEKKNFLINEILGMRDLVRSHAFSIDKKISNKVINGSVNTVFAFKRVIRECEEHKNNFHAWINLKRSLNWLVNFEARFKKQLLRAGFDL